MAALSLQDLGSLGEFLSSIGVIATLLYLAVEVRRNTRTAQETSSQRTFERFSSSRSLIASNPTLAEIVEKVTNDVEITNSERRQWEAYIGEYGYSIYYYVAAAEDFSNPEVPDSIDGAIANLASLLNNDLGRKYLKRGPFPKSFVESIMQKIEGDV